MFHNLFLPDVVGQIANPEVSRFSHHRSNPALPTLLSNVTTIHFTPSLVFIMETQGSDRHVQIMTLIMQLGCVS